MDGCSAGKEVGQGGGSGDGGVERGKVHMCVRAR